MNIPWSHLWEKFKLQVFEQGGYHTILDGLKNTLIIAIGGFIIGIILGAVLAILQLLPNNKVTKVLRGFAKGYVGVFRGTPIVVQLLLGWYVLKPILGIRSASALLWGMVIFGMNSGAYVSEIIRGGILSVDKGQMEAGRSLGLSYMKTMFKIVLPQAFKNSLPSLGNELIAIVKETSVAGFISVVDLQVAFKQQDTAYNPIICYLMLALVYIVLVLLFTALIKLIERRMRASDNR
ncbi:MAG: amino acid ABC transporter permease [Clostridiales bacterium]|nr:amino acid ABC transporter permease [Clostridiales bacterium]